MDENDIFDGVKELGFSEFMCLKGRYLTSEQLKDVFFGFYDSVFDLIGESGISDLLPAGLDILTERFDLED